MEENLSGGLKGYSSRTYTQEGKAIKRYLFWIYLLKMKKKKKKKKSAFIWLCDKKDDFPFYIATMHYLRSNILPKMF